jgi:hypothetical protein
VDAARHLPAHQPSARRVHLLHLLCRGWAGAVGVLLPFHFAGVLRPPAATPIAALPHSGGDLHLLQQDICLRAAIGHSVPTVPHVAMVQEGFRPDQRLVLQLRAKGLIVYITPISPGKWDRWREDWVIVRVDVDDCLALPTESPTAKHSDWEETPKLHVAYGLDVYRRRRHHAAGAHDQEDQAPDKPWLLGDDGAA